MIQEKGQPGAVRCHFVNLLRHHEELRRIPFIQHLKLEAGEAWQEMVVEHPPYAAGEHHPRGNKTWRVNHVQQSFMIIQHFQALTIIKHH